MAQSRTETVRFFALCVAFGAVIGGLAQTTRTTWNTSANTCSWSQEDTDDWIGSIMAGSIIGWIFALILSILGCIPLCCSGPTLKAQATIIGIVCILGGLFAFFIPAIAGAAATSGAIDDYCDRCQAEGYSSCSEADRDEAKDDIAAHGINMEVPHTEPTSCKKNQRRTMLRQPKFHKHRQSFKTGSCARWSTSSSSLVTMSFSYA